MNELSAILITAVIIGVAAYAVFKYFKKKGVKTLTSTGTSVESSNAENWMWFIRAMDTVFQSGSDADKNTFVSINRARINEYSKSDHQFVVKYNEIINKYKS